VTGLASRPRLDTGTLGVFSLLVPTALAATHFIADFAAGKPGHYEGYLSWNTPALTVDSGSPVAVGLDGESLQMDPPLVFTSRPGVLRIRLHAAAIGYSPAARAQPLGSLTTAVVNTALGRPADRGG